MLKLTVLATVLALTGCDITDPSETPDASTGPDAFELPTYREAECIKLCVPEWGMCEGADLYQCRRDCERATGLVTDHYCPVGGDLWHEWECSTLCENGQTCEGFDTHDCKAECLAWVEPPTAYCPSS